MSHCIPMNRFALAHPTLAALAALAVALPASAAPQCPPDAFEPNDLCAQAAPVGAGVHSGLTASPSQLDHYRIDVPAGQRLDLSLTFLQPAAGLSGFAFLFADDGSGSPCDSFQNSVAAVDFTAQSPTAALAWSAPKTAPATFILQVQAFGDDCADYELAVAIAPDPCALPDDAFEPNDTCATAAPLGLGTFGGLNAGIVDPDHFAFTLAPKEVLTVALSGLAPTETVTMFAWDPNNNCGDTNAIVSAGVVHGPATGGLYLANTGVVPRTFVVNVVPTPNQETGVGFCVDYSLSVTSEFDPCGALTGDAFEPNSSCFTAAPLSATQTGLTVHSWMDQDWYAIDVPARSTLRLRSKSTLHKKVGPMMLWSGCGGNPDFLASSAPWLFDLTDPRHFLKWHNAADFGVDTRLLMISNNLHFPQPFCDVYQVEFALTLGETYCLPAKNSSGDAALLSASGSTQVGVGTLELSAAPVPANSIGLVFFGPATKAPTPFGGGWMCTQGPLLRLPGATTGAAGVLNTSIDWTGTASAIAAGQSFAFQAWFRDAAANPTFNLSDGLEIAFQ
jgi:hypothetical protein